MCSADYSGILILMDWIQDGYDKSLGQSFNGRRPSNKAPPHKVEALQSIFGFELNLRIDPTSLD